jgi:hypothetical protein
LRTSIEKVRNFGRAWSVLGSRERTREVVGTNIRLNIQ